MESSYIGLAAIVERGMVALEHAVNEAANDLVKRSAEAAPKQESTLAGSIHTDGAERHGATVTAIVATGGEASAYAAYQHEGHRADGSHVIRNHPGGGQQKYIEAPLLAMGPVYIAHLRVAVAAAY